MSESSRDLGNTRRDYLVAGLRGAAGALPFVGGLVAEVIGSVIPNQRLDRITAFLHILDAKLGHLAEEQIRQCFENPEAVDLLEDGLTQAARSMGDERREWIASLLKNALTRDDLTHIQKKKLLSLLGDLNDVELLILQSLGIPFHRRGEFLKQHQDALYGPAAHMGSSQEEIDQDAVHRTYREHLRRLGLARVDFKQPKRGEMPEFDDKTGMIKARGESITPLGDLLLRYLDLETESDAA